MTRFAVLCDSNVMPTGPRPNSSTGRFAGNYVLNTLSEQRIRVVKSVDRRSPRREFVAAATKFWRGKCSCGDVATKFGGSEPKVPTGEIADQSAECKFIAPDGFLEGTGSLHHARARRAQSTAQWEVQ
jgi:hypothetical protein